MNLTIDELLDYTEEERAKWQSWFSAHGNDPLKIALAGGTFTNIGALILHCFWAELWYAHWMRGEILTENSEIVRQNNNLPTDQAEVIFSFGHVERACFCVSPEGLGYKHRAPDGAGSPGNCPSTKKLIYPLIP
jgi:hypothetical protein